MPSPLLSDSQYKEIKDQLATAIFTVTSIKETTDINAEKCALINYTINASGTLFEAAIEATVFQWFSKKVSQVAVVPEFPTGLITNYEDLEKTAFFFGRTLKYAQKSQEALKFFEMLLTYPEEEQFKVYKETDTMNEALNLVGEKTVSFFNKITKSIKKEEKFVLEEPKHLLDVEVLAGEIAAEKEMLEVHIKGDRELCKQIQEQLKYENIVVQEYQKLCEKRTAEADRIQANILIDVEEYNEVLEQLMKEVKKARVLQESVQNEIDVELRGKMLTEYQELCKRIGDAFIVAKEFGAEVQAAVVKFYENVNVQGVTVEKFE